MRYSQRSTDVKPCKTLQQTTFIAIAAGGGVEDEGTEVLGEWVLCPHGERHKRRKTRQMSRLPPPSTGAAAEKTDCCIPCRAGTTAESRRKGPNPGRRVLGGPAMHRVTSRVWRSRRTYRRRCEYVGRHKAPSRNMFVLLGPGQLPNVQWQFSSGQSNLMYWFTGADGWRLALRREPAGRLAYSRDAGCRPCTVPPYCYGLSEPSRRRLALVGPDERHATLEPVQKTKWAGGRESGAA